MWPAAKGVICRPCPLPVKETWVFLDDLIRINTTIYRYTFIGYLCRGFIPYTTKAEEAGHSCSTRAYGTRVLQFCTALKRPEAVRMSGTHAFSYKKE